MKLLSSISTDEILDRLPAGLLAFGDDGVVVSANRTLCAMLAYKAEEVIGRHVEQLLTVPSRIFYQTHVFPLLKMKGRVEEVYLSLRTNSGEDIPTLINGCRFEADSKLVNECLLVPMRRRSDYEEQILAARRQAEAAVQEKNQTNAELELAHKALQRQQEELRERNCELEELREGLEEQVQLRTAELTKIISDLEGFNYSIAHDFRAPLRAIIATSSMLLEDAAHLTSTDRDLLMRQRRNGAKMAELLEDLLQFSRLGLSPVRKQPVDITALAHQVVGAVLADQARNDLLIHVQPGLTAEADPSMLQVALHNLLDNAVKYSPGGGKISVGGAAKEGRPALFVRDQGIGIAPQYLEQIFRPFERLHRDEEFQGTGIGLANTKRIIERHGGRIWVESSPGAGTTFWFTLG